ncbi:MAG TPA: DUF4174 domain-containing protein [Hyphomicrobiaceae bacterium]|nr:DUF4174 domain-containing protein [Hyphomicrobiaceae bacterium]
MRRSALITALLAIMLTPSAAFAMSGYMWKKRPLVVFAPDGNASALASQRAIVAGARGGFAERHMVVVWVVGDSVSSELGGGPGLSAADLRRRYGVARGSFRAILIGKDGGAKISSSKPLAAGMLFSTIDAMPMRRDEMRGR